MEHAWLPVGLVVNGVDSQYKISKSKAVEAIVEEICSIFKPSDDPSDMCLWLHSGKFSNGTSLVTNETKCQIIPGSMLELRESPTKMSLNLIDNLFHNLDDNLQLLLRESDDITISKCLAENNAQDVVYNMFLKSNENECCINAIIFIQRQYNRKLIRKVPQRVIGKIYDFLVKWAQSPKMLVIEGLNLLSSIRRYGRLYHKEGIFKNLELCLRDCNDSDIQTAVLKHLNYLVIYPNNTEDELTAMKNVVNERTVRCIYNKIIPKPTPKGLQQQLYIFQTLTLRKYWVKKNTKVKNTDPIIVTLKDMSKRARKGAFVERRIVHQSYENLPTTPKISLTTMMESIKSSFRWPKRNNKESPLGERQQPSRRTLSPSRVMEKLTKPRGRKGPRFYSCIQSGADDDEREDNFPFSFQFYGSFEFRTSLEQEHFAIPPSAALRKSASASELSTMNYSVAHEESKDTDKHVRHKFTISLLTVENLKYLNKHHPNLYHKWSLTKRKRYTFADQITQMLCRLLEVGSSRHIDHTSEAYHPLLFRCYPYFLETLFCESLLLHEKTSKEMKAKIDSDLPKVLEVMKRQLSSALNAKPLDLNSLWHALNATPFEVIELKMLSEMRERIHFDLTNKPLFLEYRAECKGDVYALIKSHRESFMKKGQHLPKVSIRGDISKACTDFLALSFNKQFLITRECKIGNCGDSSHLDDIKTIPVENLVEVTYGKSSPIYSQVLTNSSDSDPFFRTRILQPEEHWSRLITIKLNDGSYYNFCAIDKVSLDYWIDGINILMGKPMSTATAEKEMASFLDLEVRLHFLEVEGIPIPDSPPAIPPPPPNYDFFGKKSRVNSKSSHMESNFC